MEFERRLRRAWAITSFIAQTLHKPCGSWLQTTVIAALRIRDSELLVHWEVLLEASLRKLRTETGLSAAQLYLWDMAVILSINAGSSSVKVSVYKAADKRGEFPNQVAEAQIAGLTAPPASLTYKKGRERTDGKEVTNIGSQEEAFEYILDCFVKDHGLEELETKDSITHTCHRVVHGGEYPTHVLDAAALHHIEDLTDLAPLHNASALAIVKFCIQSLPKAKNIAYFDTSFHSTIPQATFTYPINPKVAQQNRLRKYGFHGISYAFISRTIAKHLKKDVSETSLIALHLGSGASACAIKNGKSVDTSMGLTPLDGLPGATRSGTVDPR